MDRRGCGRVSGAAGTARTLERRLGSGGSFHSGNRLFGAGGFDARARGLVHDIGGTRRRLGRPVPSTIRQRPGHTVFGRAIGVGLGYNGTKRVCQVGLAARIAEAEARICRVKRHEAFGRQSRALWEGVAMLGRQAGLENKAAQVKVFGVGVIQLDEFVAAIGARAARVWQQLGDLRRA